MNEVDILNELMGETLSQEVIKDLEEMVIYITDSAEDLCDEEAEDECSDEEAE